MRRLRDVRNAGDGAVLINKTLKVRKGGIGIITKEDLFEIFSDAAEDNEKSFGDRLKAGEFLMKYCFCGNGTKKDDRVVIIDDIRTRLENGG